MTKTTNTTTAISNPLIHSPPDFLSLRFADFLILRASSPRSSRAALRGCIIILMRRAVYIGENLERLRLRAALSQIGLAKNAWATPAALNCIERNRLEPQMRTIPKLAKALDVEPHVLIEGP